MPFKSLLYLGSGIAALGFAIGTLFFLARALIGRYGEPRRRRLRFALASAALLTPTPEPSTWELLVTGGAALFLVGRRKIKAARPN